MARLVIHALVVLTALVTATLVNTIPDAPEALTVSATVAAAIVAPLGARGALERLFSMLPEAWRREIVTTCTVLAVAATTLQAAVLEPPVALTVGLAVLIATTTAIGGRSQGTSLVDPRDADGRPLVPAADSSSFPRSAP